MLRTVSWGFFLITTFLTACGNQADTVHDREVYNLENGMEVILWENRNSHSSDEISMNLVVHSGSLHEQDDQLGYAHFVEHMAFEQANAEERRLINQIQDLGISFGTHSNAYTTFDHTNFYFEYPNPSLERIEATLSLLENLVYDAKFDESDVERQRKIVREEWRLSQPNENRARFKITQKRYEGDRYGRRLPIGTISSINDASAAKLQRFYQTHYRAANTSLIVAGDYDRDAVKAIIESLFNDKPNAGQKRARKYVEPAIPQDSVAIFSDPMQQAVDASLLFDFPSKRPTSEQESADAYLSYAVADILFKRIEAKHFDRAGVLQAYDVSTDQVGDESGLLSTTVTSTPANTKTAIKLLATEIERLKTHGVAQTELDQWRDKRINDERSQQDSAGHLASVAAGHVVSGDWLRGQSEYFAMLKKHLPKISIADLNDRAALILEDPAKLMLIVPADARIPEATELRQWATVDPATLAPAEATDTASSWELKAPSGDILSTEKLENGIHLYTLSNGMRVQFQYSDSAPEKVYMLLIGMGGLNQLNAADAINARLAMQAMSASGLRGLDGPGLASYLQDEGLELSPGYYYHSRELYAAAHVEKLDLLQRIVHIALTEGQVASPVLEHYKAQNKDQLAEIAASPRNAFDQKVQAIYNTPDDALRQMTLEEVSRINADEILGVYNDYYSGARNYVVSIVGDIDHEQLEDMLKRNIASIPKSEQSTKPKRSVPMLESSTTVHGSGNNERGAGVTLVWQIDRQQLTEPTEHQLTVLARLLSNKLREVIREEKGLVYSISAHFTGALHAYPQQALQVDFACDPEDVDEVIAQVKATLLAQSQTTLSQNEVNQFVEQERETFKQSKNQAKIILQQLAAAESRGLNLAIIDDTRLRLPSINAEKLDQHLRNFMDNDKHYYGEFVIKP